MPLKSVCVAIMLVAQANPAFAQSGKGPGAQDTRSASGSRPVIGCPSLANLRMVLKTTGDDVIAAIPIITDPRSDLGCSVLDPASVTGIADHLSLNEKAYECLISRGTSICHWTVAGSVLPAKKAPSPPSEASPAPAGKSRH